MKLLLKVLVMLLVLVIAGGAYVWSGAYDIGADVPHWRLTARVLDAVSLLRDVGEGEPPRLGRRVVVYGGGNTAMDAARQLGFVNLTFATSSPAGETQ